MTVILAKDTGNSCCFSLLVNPRTVDGPIRRCFTSYPSCEKSTFRFKGRDKERERPRDILPLSASLPLCLSASLPLCQHHTLTNHDRTENQSTTMTGTMNKAAAHSHLRRNDQTRKVCSLSTLVFGLVWVISLWLVLQVQLLSLPPTATGMQHKNGYDASSGQGGDLSSRPQSVPSVDSSSSSSLSAMSKGQPLNPFVDLVLTKAPPTTTTATESTGKGSSSSSSSPMSASPSSVLPYSSVNCVQADQSGYPDYQARTCEYTNLYYRPADQTFHYYVSPEEITFHRNATHDGIDSVRESITVADGFLRWDKLLTGLETHSTDGNEFSYEWQPTVSQDMAASADRIAEMQSPAETVFVLYHPSYSFNFGHLVFDDLLSLYSLQEMFGYNTPHSDATSSSSSSRTTTTVPLFVERPNKDLGINFGKRDPFWRCSPTHQRWDMCRKLWTRVYPPLLGVQPDPASGDILRTGNFLRGIDSIGLFDTEQSGHVDIHRGSHNVLPSQTDFVRLPRVIAGAGRLANWACKGECAIGRGAYLWGFRKYLLQNIFGVAAAKQLVDERPSPETGYITFSLPIGTTHPDKVTMFEDMIAATKARHGKDRVQVVDMAKLSIDEQARLVQNTIVYITNHGGGSASAVFLPRGATLMIFHGIGRLGEPKMLDRHFWNSLAYARTLWIHPEQHHDVERAMAMVDYSLRSYPM